MTLIERASMERCACAASGDVPRLPSHHVCRPRIVEHLRAAADSRLVVVHGSPGTGKTTSVLEWLSETSSHVAWVSLSHEDAQPQLFWHRLLRAVRLSLECGWGPVSARVALYGMLSAQLSPAVRGWLQALGVPRPLANTIMPERTAQAGEPAWPAARHGGFLASARPMPGLSDRIVLVLDHSEHLLGSAALAGLHDVVIHLPEPLTIVMITTQPLPYPLADWRRRGIAAEVDADTLAFRADETAELLAQLGVEPSGIGVEFLQRSTGGSPAMLSLAAESLLEAADPTAALDQITRHDRVIDDLAAEVFRPLSAPDTQLLLRLALINEREIELQQGAPLRVATMRSHDQERANGRATLVDPLTRRELEILQLLPSRLTLREIGAQVFVSLNTVKTHVAAIYRKLGVVRRADAVREAVHLHLLPFPYADQTLSFATSPGRFAAGDPATNPFTRAG